MRIRKSGKFGFDLVKLCGCVRKKLVDQILDRNDLVHEPDRLACHQRACFHIAFDNGAAESSHPEFFHFHLGFLSVNRAFLQFFEKLKLESGESIMPFVLERADGDDRKTGIELRRCNGVAGVGMHERILEFRVRGTFVRHDETGSDLNTGGSHEQCVRHHFTRGDAACDEYRNLIAEFEQKLLDQNHRGDVSDVSAGFTAFEHDCVRPETDHAFGNGKRGGKADGLLAGVLGDGDLFFFRNGAREKDVINRHVGKGGKLFLVSGCDSDQIDRKGFVRQRSGFFDLGTEHPDRGIASGDTGETAVVADHGNKFRIGDPGHGSADDRIFHIQEFAAPLHHSAKVGIYTVVMIDCRN